MLALKQPLPRGVHVFLHQDPSEVVKRIIDPKNARVYELPSLNQLSPREIDSLLEYLSTLDSEGEYISVWKILSDAGKV